MWGPLVLTFAWLSLAATAEAQPRAVAAASERGDTPPAESSALHRPARLHVRGVPLNAALTKLAERSGVVVAFSPSRLRDERLVECECTQLTVAQALDRLLESTAYRYAEVDGHVVVVPKPTSHPARARDPLQPPPPVYAMLPQPRSLASLQPLARPEVRRDGTITGRVTDAATGSPLRLANVRLEETRRGAVTGVDGRYRLENVPPGTHTLVASMIGYLEARQAVSVATGVTVTADFALTLSPARLDEVVATATGEQRRVELGHVVGRIDAEAVVREAPVTRLSDLIGARVAGVQIIPSTGLSGEAPGIRIRGLGSISRSREPLFYVDGVRVESTAGAQGAYGIVSGRVSDLNPNEVESIEVVKGPSAATLYGTDAANGVVLIRTRRGQSGNARWNFYLQGGELRPSTSFKNVDSYYSWGTNLTGGQPQRCFLLQMAAGVCVQDSLTVFNPLTDAETTPIGTGRRLQYGGQVSGGSPHLTYFLSGEHEQETGYLRMPAQEIERIREERGGAKPPEWQVHPNSLDRLSVRGTLAATLGETADVRMSSGLVSSRTRIPGNTIFQAGYWGIGYRDSNDGWRPVPGRPGEIFAIKSAEEVARYSASLNARWQPSLRFSARATVGTDLSSTYFDGLQRAGEGPFGPGRDGRRLNTRTNVAQHTIDLGASTFAELNRGLTSRTSVGTQYHRRGQLVTIASATNLPPGSETVTGAAAPMGQEGREESVVAGAYVEQMFGVNDRVFVTGAVRADGGSSFGRQLRIATYPKASVSWLLSREPFFPRVPLLENLRLRAAYGHSGVQPGTTDALDLVTRFTSILDGTTTSGAALGRLGNQNLKPERQREIEGGVDVDLMSGRITLEATYYDRLSTDALLEAPLAASVGSLNRWVNVGSVRNWGYEAALTVSVVETADLKWDVDMNGSVNKNRLERLGIPGVNSLGFNTLGLHREGFPLFGRWDRPILGFEDTNGNGIIERSEVQVGDTTAYIGPSHPPRQITAATTLSAVEGRLRLSSQFDYRGGHVGMNLAVANHCNSFQSCRAINDREASLVEQARAVARTQYGTSAGYMQNASFIRWRELAVSYQVPAALGRRIGTSDLTITLSGRNLRLWTDYMGVDPEVNSSPGLAIIEGTVENPMAPQSRYWLMRMDLRF